MPILGDIRDDPNFAPMFKQVAEEGWQEGLKEGKSALLRKQIERRFEANPDWVHARLVSAAPDELETIRIRLLDSRSLAELFD